MASCIPSSWTFKKIDCETGADIELLDTVTDNTNAVYNKDIGVTYLADYIITQESTSTQKTFAATEARTLYTSSAVLTDHMCVVSPRTPYADVITSLSPVVWYTLNESVTPVDLTGNTTASYVGNVVTGESPLLNNSSTASITINTPEEPKGVELDTLVLNQQNSIVCTIKPTTNDIARNIVTTHTSGASWQTYNLSIDSGNKLKYQQNNTAGPTTGVVSSNTSLVSGTTYLAIVTFDGTDIKLYVDGALEGTVNWPNTIAVNNNTNTRIGYNPSTTNIWDSFVGSIDDVSFYDKALSQIEIDSIYNAYQLSNTSEVCTATHLVDSIGVRDTLSLNEKGPLSIYLNDTLNIYSPISYIYDYTLQDILQLVLDSETQSPNEVAISLTDYINSTFVLNSLYIPIEYFYLLADTVNASSVIVSGEVGNEILLLDTLHSTDQITVNGLDFLLDAIQTSESIELPSWYVPAFDTLNITDTLVLGYLKALVDTVDLRDAVRLQYHLMDLIRVLSNLKWVESYTLEDTIEAIDEIFQVISEVLIDNIDVGELQVISLLQELLDSLSIGDNLAFISYNDLVDTINIKETITPIGLYNLLLHDNITLDVFVVDKDSIKAFVLNPRTNSVVNYTNWNFNSYAEHNNKTYAANETGLYEIGGNTDAGEYIKSYIKTAKLGFGTSEVLALEQAYITIDLSGNFILSMEDDNGTKAVYTFPAQNNLNMNRVQLPKGMKSHFFTFELEDVDSEKFNLDTLELQPIQYTRRMK